MEHDGNDVDAAFEALIAREFGEVVTAPGRPRPNGLPTQRAPAHVPQEPPRDADEMDEPLPMEPAAPPSPATKGGIGSSGDMHRCRPAGHGRSQCAPDHADTSHHIRRSRD